tara:strand:- start:315 stop:653 length:339 start_codon:yes stop_codon:yes gene_type:complete
MIDFIKTWSKEEFKLYLLIYAAQANLVEEEEELESIESKFSKDDINRIYKNVKNLNDFHRCQIIIDFIKSNDFNQDELDGMLLEVEQVFKSDGKFDVMEQQSFYMLKKLLKA